MFATLMMMAATMLPTHGPQVVSSRPVLVHGALYALNVYDNGQVALLGMDGEMSMACSGDGQLSLPGMASSDEDLPPRKIITRWTDEQGAEHEVVTLVSGRTMSEIKAATDRHIALVKLIQRIYPPAPPKVGDSTATLPSLSPSLHLRAA